jgi:hypothetical protein
MYITLAITAVLLVIINLIPTGRGLMLSCYGGSEHYYSSQKTSGFPLTYLKRNPTGNDCFAVSGVNGHDISSITPKKYDRYVFSPLNFVIDAALTVAVLVVQGLLLMYKTGRKKT